MPDPAADTVRYIEHVLDAARIAPSQDNMQPWRFLVEGDTVSFLVDHERDRSPANAGGRMARIAVGAALECALLRAGRNGSVVHFLEPRPGALVTLRLSPPKRLVEADKALVRRATNRRLYDGRPLDDATFAWLQQATPPLDGVRTLWFGRERVRALGPIVEEGEAAFYADARAREAALRAVRFDVRDNEEVPHGLSVGSLEMSASERMTLDALRHTPEDRLVAMGAMAKMGAHARRLVESASGVCVVVARGGEAGTPAGPGTPGTPGTPAAAGPAVDVAVGRCMQRAWLGLTRRGLVAQPMGAIPALEAMGEEDERAGVKGAAQERAAAAVAALRAAFPSLEKGARVAVLLRVGYAPPPTTLVRRLPLADSLATAPEKEK
jgi:nitroreductase